MTLPVSFKAFLSEIGGCWYCGLITVYVPWVVREKLGDYDFFLKNQFFPWDSSDLMSLQKLAQCVKVAGTIDGDAVVVHPDHPERFFILPRHQSKIYVYDESFESLLRWIVCDGQFYTSEFEDADDIPPDDLFVDPCLEPYVEGIPYFKDA